MNIPYEVSCGTPWILLALVIAVLAVPQVVTMEATLRPLTDVGLQSLIDRFDLLLLILVAVIGIGLFVAFVSQLYGISILAKEPNQVHTLRHHVIRRESRSICTRPFLFLQIMPFAQDSNARPPSPQKDSLGFKTLY